MKFLFSLLAQAQSVILTGFMMMMMQSNEIHNICDMHGPTGSATVLYNGTCTAAPCLSRFVEKMGKIFPVVLYGNCVPSLWLLLPMIMRTLHNKKVGVGGAERRPGKFVATVIIISFPVLLAITVMT